MRKIIPVLLLGSLLFIAALYVNATNPYFFQDLGINIGDQSATASNQDYGAVQAERERISKINSLIISSQNKRDLREGRPFWGAAQHMIALAMSAPADSTIVRTKDNIFYEFHSYRFDGRREPVTFEFKANRLQCLHYLNEKRSICGESTQSYYNQNDFPYPSMLTQN